MKKCPKCKRTMTKKMAYNNGTPIISFHCMCGYSDGQLYTGQQKNKSHFLRKMKK